MPKSRVINYVISGINGYKFDISQKKYKILVMSKVVTLVTDLVRLVDLRAYYIFHINKCLCLSVGIVYLLNM